LTAAAARRKSSVDEGEPDRDILPDDREPADDERARIVSLLGPAPVQIDDLV
jgi:hypothetical protein